MRASTRIFSAGLRPDVWRNAIFGIILCSGVLLTATHLWLGLYPMAAIVALATVLGMLLIGTEHVSPVALALRPELALSSHIAPAHGPVTLKAVRSVGDCARGYGQAEEWTIASDGTVSPQICRAAAEAVAPLLGSIDTWGTSLAGIDCSCPMVNRCVTFSLQAKPAGV